MIERTEVENLAKLARLELNEAELERVARDLGGILNYVEQLNAAGGQAAVELAETHLPVNVLRDDGPAHETASGTEALVAAAPKHNGAFVRVKKIL